MSGTPETLSENQPKTETTTTTTETKDQSTQSTPETTDKSLLNEEAAKTTETKSSEGAPEKYSDFTLPDGFEANPEVMTKAQTIFKELGLPQDGAQKLVSLYAEVSSHAAKAVEEAQSASLKYWEDTNKTWRDEIKADPEIGGRLDQVKTTIGRAIDGLGDAKLASAFREAMDLTGAGNNPAFIRAFYKLAQKVTEGSHVTGRPQNTAGKPPSAASAMYPALPSSTGA